jgi:hypothetical protein
MGERVGGRTGEADGLACGGSEGVVVGACDRGGMGERVGGWMGAVVGLGCGLKEGEVVGAGDG